ELFENLRLHCIYRLGAVTIDNRSVRSFAIICKYWERLFSIPRETCLDRLWSIIRTRTAHHTCTHHLLGRIEINNDKLFTLIKRKCTLEHTRLIYRTRESVHKEMAVRIYMVMERISPKHNREKERLKHSCIKGFMNFLFSKALL